MQRAYRNVPIDSIKPNPHNARTHSTRQIKQIAESIAKLGFAGPVLLDEIGVLLAGEGRWRAAQLLKLKEIPAVIISGLTEAQKRALLLADNKIAMNSGWDRKRLAVEIPELSNDPKAAAVVFPLLRATGHFDEDVTAADAQLLPPERANALAVDYFEPQLTLKATSIQSPGKGRPAPMKRNMRPPPVPNDVIAYFLRDDLYSFVQASFPLVSGGATLVQNWHIEAICTALVKVKRGETKRLIITVPPRYLKSICTSVAFPAFLLGHDPTTRIILVSYSESLARKHANDCRALMRSPMYLKVFPGTRISSEKDTELEFMTTKRGFRLATSVGGTLTGRGGNIIIIDDPLKPQDAYSDTAREQLNDWYGRTLLSRLDNKAQDPIIIVMQRLHVDDLVGRLLEQGGWTVLNLPAIAEVDELIPLRPGWNVHRHPGDLLHPEREPKHVLDEIKHAMGSVDFAAQYQQQPVPPKGHMIDWSWFGFYDKLPVLRPSDRVVLSWDTAMSANELADYSVCTVLLVRQDAVFVLDVIRERLDYPNLRRRVIELYGRWRKVHSNTILAIENLGSGMSLIQDLRAQHIYPIAVDPRGDKVMRMHQQTARIEAGGVFLPLHAHWLDEFKREILSFPHGRYDDQVDALSQGLDRAFNHRAPVAATGVYVRT